MLVLRNMYRDLIQVGRASSATHFVVFLVFQIDESGMLLTVMVLVPLTSCVKYTFLDFFGRFVYRFALILS